MKTRNLVIRIVTFVLFGLLILSFAVWGIGDIFRGPGQKRSVAEVGDARIDQQDFARALSREVNRLSARFGGRIDMEQLRALGAVDQVLGQMIARALFDQKADELGLVVTDEQIKRRITEEAAFQNDRGQFDRNRFIQTLQVSNLSEQEFVDSLRGDILRQQIADAMTEAVSAPRQLAETLYRYREERRVAQVLTVPYASITDLPEPDEAALQAFHKEFAANFMAPEYRALSLVRLRAEDLAAEIAVSETELRKEFESRREEFVTPERRRVEQIVFLDEAAASEADTRLKGGADFATVAQELAGQPPVDLGLLERDGLPPELAEPAFALEENGVSGPLKSPLGWHILRVTKIEPQKEPTFEDVREDLTRDMAMSRAVDSMVSIANQLDDELAGGASLEEAAARLDFQLRRIEAIDRQGRDPEGHVVDGLPRDRFLEIAFATEPGEESLLTETSDGGYFIVRVDGVTPAQLRPLEEVRDQVAEIWRNAQRAQRAGEVAKALAERAKRGEKLEALAKAEGYELTTTEALSRFEGDPARSPSPALPPKLFQIAPGEVTTVNAPAGHLVVKLLEVRPADPSRARAEVAALQEGLAAAMRADVLDQFVAVLRGEYGVQVNERLVEDVLATF
ncbi:MAG: peptidyl-prolyl cis-trans isomerase [Kiloniellaceae bacterium]